MPRRSKQERLVLEARRRLEADLRAGDISPENHDREDARITAGTSRYLEPVRRKGFLDRAAHGDRGAILRIVLIVVVLAIGGSVAGSALSDDDDRPAVQQIQTQPEFDDDDDEGEDEDDDG